MSFALDWLPEAVSAYRRLRAADPEGPKRIASVVAGLAADPYSPESTPLGGTSFRRTAGYVSIITECCMKSPIQVSRLCMSDESLAAEMGTSPISLSMTSCG